MALSVRERALREVSQILQEDEDARRRSEEHLYRRILNWHGRNAPEVWKTSRSGNAIRIDFSTNHRILFKNVKACMLKETLGLGPARYCITYDSTNFPFVIYLQVILENLPRQKLCIYPTPPPFTYSFLSPALVVMIRVCLRQPTFSLEEFEAEFGN